MKDGEIYVDGAGFASKLGGTYTEIETDAYTGFEIYYESDDYFVIGSSNLIKDSSKGQLYACEYNEKIDAGIKASITVMDLLVTALTGGGSKSAQAFASAVNATAVAIDLSNIDFSYKVQVCERITISHNIVVALASTTYRTTIRNEEGEIRVDQKQYMR